MSEQPGKYTRSFSGLIASIIVSVVAVVGFVGIRSLVRDDVDIEPETVDYLETVSLAQQAGLEVVYPAELPDGWRATSVDVQPGSRPAFGVGMLTADSRFAGVRQEVDRLDDLLATYVEEDDEDLTELDPVQLDSEVAAQWQVFEDTGGDRAYAAEVGESWVLVYGSAADDDLQTLVGSLTTAERPLR